MLKLLSENIFFQELRSTRWLRSAICGFLTLFILGHAVHVTFFDFGYPFVTAKYLEAVVEVRPTVRALPQGGGLGHQKQG